MTVEAYCINLDRRPDRWARMQTLAADRGLGLTRIAAVDAADPAAAPAIEGLPAHGPTGALGAGPARLHACRTRRSGAGCSTKAGPGRWCWRTT